MTVIGVLVKFDTGMEMIVPVNENQAEAISFIIEDDLEELKCWDEKK
jgi:hypothetical protein